MKSSIRPGRRRFLQAAAGGLAVAGLAACGDSKGQESGNVPAQPKPDAPKPDTPKPQPKMKQGTLLTGGSRINAATGEKNWVLSQVNLDKTLEHFTANDRSPQALMAWSNENARIMYDVGFLVHGVIPNPNRPERLLVFEKKGNGGAEVDLKENKVVTRIPPAPGNEFYGHGGYSADGSQVYATEYDAETYVGSMVVRDAKDFKVLGEFPTHGEWPHDCQFIDGGKTVAITNGGGHLQGGPKPNVSYVEVGSGKLLDKIEFENPNINAGHLFITPAGDLAVLHAMREGLNTTEALGALSLRPKGKDFRTLTDPAEITGAMKGETLSVAWDAKEGIVAVTNPYGNIVTFWRMADRAFVERRKLRQPRGIALTLDGKYYAITYDKENPNLHLLPAGTREVEKLPIQFPLACDGSHAYVYDYAI